MAQYQAEFSNPLVRDVKNQERKAIIQRNFEADQSHTLERWVATLLDDNQHAQSFTLEDSCTDDFLVLEPAHEENKQACNIMRFVLAAIAQGNFQVKTEVEGEFHAPSTYLQLTDYISHASRILFDLSQLSEGNKNILRPYFNYLEGRASTHYASLKNQIAAEHKSPFHGAAEWLKNQCNSAFGVEIFQGTDFGINIRMGGPQSQCRLGTDGHLLCWKTPDFNLLLIGVEQTDPGQAPRAGLSADDDKHFGITGPHSILGTPDDYTSSNSLYFSNPIYKLKLFAATHTLPPIKYNGMKVVINNENFSSVMDFLQTLTETADTHALSQLLALRPSTSRNQDDVSLSDFLSQVSNTDINAFFKQLSDVDPHLKTQIKQTGLVASFINKIEFIRAVYNGDVSQQLSTERLLDLACPNIKMLVDVVNRALQAICNKNEEKVKALIHEPCPRDAASILRLYPANLESSLKNELDEACQELVSCSSLTGSEEMSVSEKINAFMSYIRAHSALSFILTKPELKIIKNQREKIEKLEEQHAASIPDVSETKVDSLDLSVSSVQVPSSLLSSVRSMLFTAKDESTAFESVIKKFP